MRKIWKLLDVDATGEWVIVEEGSEAEQFPMRFGADGGILGCSEWLWLEKDVARRIVRLHNEAIAKGDVS